MSLTDLAWVSGSTSNTMRRSVTLSGAEKVMPRWRHSSTSYFGASYSYLTNSRCAVSAKSLIGNTDLNTACKPSVGRPPCGGSMRRNWSYEAFCTSMRFGISPTSLTCPKTLRTRLRPVNVCAMSFLKPQMSRRSALAPDTLSDRPGLPGAANAPFWSHQQRFDAPPPSFRPDRILKNAHVQNAQTAPGRGRGPSVPEKRARTGPRPLFELDLRAGLLEGGLDFLGFFLADAFLDGFRRAFDKVLGFLEAERGDGAHFLDDFDLLFADGGEDDGELRLFLDRRSRRHAAGRGSRHRHRSGGRDAPLGFKQLRELSGLENREAREFVDDFFEIGHFWCSLYGFEPNVCEEPLSSGCVFGGIGPDHPRKLGCGSSRELGELGRRGGQKPQQFRAQLVEGRQGRERLDPVDIEGRLAHGAAQKHEFLVIFGESHGCLGRRHRVARMSDQGRTLQEGTDRGDVRAFESNLGEAVLGDLNARPSGPHLLAQTLHLGDGQTGIVRHDHDRRLGENIVQGRGCLVLFRSIHGCSSPVGGLRGRPPVAHAAPRDSQRIERHDDLRLSPELGVPSAGQKVRTAFSERGISRRFENLVFPVYAGPSSPRGARRIKRIAPKASRAGSLGQD